MGGDIVGFITFGVRPGAFEEVFNLLSEFGVISFDLCGGVSRLVDLRNVIVNVGSEVDDRRIYDEVNGNGLRAIEEFTEKIERYVADNRAHGVRSFHHGYADECSVLSMGFIH